MVDRTKTHGYPFRHVKGPLHARELGRCLVVEVVGEGHCNFNCVYCPLSQPRTLHAGVRTFATLDTIAEEVKRKLHIHQDVDYVVLTGQGESTLHPDLNSIAAWFEAHVKARIAVITNGTHLHTATILHGINRVDQVMLSLDAVDEESFRAVSRPLTELTFAAHFKNLLSFREAYQHRLWLQVFLIRSLSLTPDRLHKLVDCIRKLNPDHVILTLGPLPSYPDYDNNMPLADRKRLSAYVRQETGIMTETDDLYDSMSMTETTRRIFELLEHEPYSLNMLAQNLGRTVAETRDLLNPLLDSAAIVEYPVKNAPHYYLCHDWRRPSLKYQPLREEELPELHFNS